MTRPSGDRSICIIDDSEDDIMFLSFALEAADASVAVTHISDPREAAGIIEATQPTLVIADLRMPTLSGDALVAQLRADPQHVTRPIVVFSSSDRAVDVHDCYVAGANAFYVKPSTHTAYTIFAKRLIDHWFDTAKTNVAAGAASLRRA